MPLSPLEIYLGTTATLVIVAVLLHVALRLSGASGGFSRAVSRAPGLDVLVFIFTALPQVTGPILGGWAGLGVSVGAQVTAMLIWVLGHELFNRHRTRGKPRIHRTLRTLIGGWRNHFAVWWTGLAVPVFWLVRFAEVAVYPPLIWTVRLPRYRQRDWINVSRHKFDGLVGYDLIWCLYCDWMTGVWSLGSEMLRNVESFWCPIRFANAEKCATCSIDFPDVENGWVAADGSMDDVSELLKKKYGSDVNAWFGHPVRLTIGASGTPTSDESSGDH